MGNINIIIFNLSNQVEKVLFVIGAPLNSLCPCGSGKKYKRCCFQNNYEYKRANKKKATFTLNENLKINREVTSLDSIPSYNKNGLQPEITKYQMMDLCIDEIHKILEKDKVGTVLELVNMVIYGMDIVPVFTYREIASRIEMDSRFSIFQMQVCSLKGMDPISLMADKLG